MYIYDIVSLIAIGIGHFLLYFILIRYDRFSFPLIIIMSLVFTIFLGTIITVTGYPEFNALLTGLFLLSLGLLQIELTLTENIYFVLANLVTISLVKLILFEFGMFIYMLLPFNLYLWTESVIHMVVTLLILIGILLLKRQIEWFATYIVQSSFYYISYVIFVCSFIVIFLLTVPGIPLLFTIYESYGQYLYVMAFLLFFMLLLIVIIASHVMKENLVQKQQEHLDEALLDYVDRLEALHDELANFRHDYINILLTLDESIRTKNLNQIEQTYYGVIAPTKDLMTNRELDIVKLANVKQAEVKSVLSVKVFEAQQENVQMLIDIPHPIAQMPVAPVKLIRIISILLDNAIEAAARSDERKIKLAFFEKDEEVYFILQNSTDEEEINLHTIYKKHYSTSGQQERGYGLHSLQQLIQEMKKATLETSFERGVFSQILKIKRASSTSYE